MHEINWNDFCEDHTSVGVWMNLHELAQVNPCAAGEISLAVQEFNRSPTSGLEIKFLPDTRQFNVKEHDVIVLAYEEEDHVANALTWLHGRWNKMI
jgi:hypothetical protein